MSPRPSAATPLGRIGFSVSKVGPVPDRRDDAALRRIRIDVVEVREAGGIARRFEDARCPCCHSPGGGRAWRPVRHAAAPANEPERQRVRVSELLHRHSPARTRDSRRDAVFPRHIKGARRALARSAQRHSGRNSAIVTQNLGRERRGHGAAGAGSAGGASAGAGAGSGGGRRRSPASAGGRGRRFRGGRPAQRRASAGARPPALRPGQLRRSPLPPAAAAGSPKACGDRRSRWRARRLLQAGEGHRGAGDEGLRRDQEMVEILEGPGHALGASCRAAPRNT